MSAEAPPAVLFRCRLPHGWCVGVSIPPAIPPAFTAVLHPDERAHLVGLHPARRPSFAAGRAALRLALEVAGGPTDLPLLSDARGAPTLPPGTRGSISHKRSIAVGLATLADQEGPPGTDSETRFDTDVGVDLEELVPPRIDISRRVLTDRELTALAGSSPEVQVSFLLTRFSLKEAVYKAVNGFVGRSVSFRDVEVTFIEAASGRVTFAGSVLERTTNGAGVDIELDGWTGSPLPGWLLASVRARQIKQA